MGRSDIPFRSQIVASIGEVEALVAERKIRGAVFAYREGEAVPIVERLNPTKVRKQDFHKFLSLKGFGNSTAPKIGYLNRAENGGCHLRTRTCCRRV
jgi:hypothetical protein